MNLFLFVWINPQIENSPIHAANTQAIKVAGSLPSVAKNKYKITNSNDLILDLTKKFTFEEAYFKSKNASKSTSIIVSDKLINSYVITCCGAENTEFYKIDI